MDKHPDLDQDLAACLVAAALHTVQACDGTEFYSRLGAHQRQLRAEFGDPFDIPPAQQAAVRDHVRQALAQTQGRHCMQQAIHCLAGQLVSKALDDKGTAAWRFLVPACVELPESAAARPPRLECASLNGAAVALALSQEGVLPADARLEVTPWLYRKEDLLARQGHLISVACDQGDAPPPLPLFLDPELPAHRSSTFYILVTARFAADAPAPTKLFASGRRELGAQAQAALAHQVECALAQAGSPPVNIDIGPPAFAQEIHLLAGGPQFAELCAHVAKIKAVYSSAAKVRGRIRASGFFELEAQTPDGDWWEATAALATVEPAPLLQEMLSRACNQVGLGCAGALEDVLGAAETMLH